MIYTIVLKDTDDSGNSVINGVISFDCIKSFSESRSATVSTQTVEKGFNISDNINIEPVQFTLDGYISSYYLKDDENEIVWGGSGFKTNNSNSKTYTHARVRDSLIAFFEERNVFTLMESEYGSTNKDVTENYNEQKRGYYKEYENCVLTSMDFSVPEASSEVFSISMKIQKITIAVVQERRLEKGEMGVLQKYRPNTDVSSVSSTTTDVSSVSSTTTDSLGTKDDADAKVADPTKILEKSEKEAKAPQTVTDVSGGAGNWSDVYESSGYGAKERALEAEIERTRAATKELYDRTKYLYE